MNRRAFLSAALAFTLLSTTDARADYVDDIVVWLKKTGFSDISVAHTLLGRIVITAHSGKRVRELVCNPRTGEILRDVWLDGDTGQRPPALPTDLLDDDHDGGGGDDDDSGHGSSNSGSGSGDHGGDDNSGHGSGGSGGKSGHGGGDDD